MTADARRCGCGGRARCYEHQSVGPFPLADRYECPDCTSRFDVATPIGGVVLGVLAAVLSGLVWLAPEERFGHGDRPAVLMLVTALSVALVGLAVRGGVMRRRHPPLS